MTEARATATATTTTKITTISAKKTLICSSFCFCIDEKGKVRTARECHHDKKQTSEFIFDA